MLQIAQKAHSTTPPALMYEYCAFRVSLFLFHQHHNEDQDDGEEKVSDTLRRIQGIEIFKGNMSAGGVVECAFCAICSICYVKEYEEKYKNTQPHKKKRLKRLLLILLQYLTQGILLSKC